MRLPNFLSAVGLAAFIGLALGSLRASEAAENFACGPGGRPDAQTAVCVCPAGKVEKTSGGTSRCVDKPSGGGSKSGVTVTATATATIAAPTATTATVPTAVPTATPSGTGQVHPQPKLPSCPPSQIATPEGCVDRCDEDETWRGGTCVPRCRGDETWTGSVCEKHRSHTAPVSCPDGKIGDGGGHCCWSGQTWGETSQRCRGKPSCPAGYEARGETCEIAECEDGALRAEDGVHCCWPGQEWSRARKACVGVPECPEGTRQTDAGCYADHRCPKGKSPTPTGQCCYKDQVWGMRIDGDVGCSGTPRCPRGLTSHGDDCMREEEADEKDSSELKSSLLGAGYFIWEIGALYQTNADATVNVTYDTAAATYNCSPGSPSTCAQHSIKLTGLHTSVAYVLGLAAHIPSFPLRLHASVEYGALRGANDTWTDGTASVDSSTAIYYGLRVGAAFAPFSLPNLGSSRDSYFNPYAGIDYRLFATSGITAGDSVTSISLSGGGFGLELGNVFAWRPFTFTVSYVLGLAGSDGHPAQTVMATVGWLSAGIHAR